MKAISNIRSLLDAISNYVFYFGSPGKTHRKVKTTYFPSAGFAGRQSGFEDLSIDVFLEIQNQKHSKILYPIGYIAYGLHIWYGHSRINEICSKPISQHPDLATGLHDLSGEMELGQF